MYHCKDRMITLLKNFYLFTYVVYSRMQWDFSARNEEVVLKTYWI